jgi:hypothetical protein
MDVSLARNFGWKAKINLKEAILKSYNSFLQEIKK